MPPPCCLSGRHQVKDLRGEAATVAPPILVTISASATGWSIGAHGFGMGEDRRTGRGKGGVAIGKIEMPVRLQSPQRGDHNSRQRSFPQRSRNRRQIAPGARRDENTGPDLRRQWR
jgi:hypothetical protein